MKKNKSAQKIAYKGKVEIRVESNGKRIRSLKANNSGTSLLFRLLVSALTKANISDSTPSYMLLKRGEETQAGDFENATALPVSVRRYYTDLVELNGDSVWEAVFVCSVPKRLIVLGTNNYLREVDLLNSDNPDSAESTTYENSTLAKLQLTGDDAIDLGSVGTNQSIIIEWHMQFYNVSEPEPQVQTAESNTQEEQEQQTETQGE